jgi:hypothetical protein
MESASQFSAQVVLRLEHFRSPIIERHADDQLAEAASFQHGDQGFRRPLQTVDEVLAITDTASGDAGADFPEERGIAPGNTGGQPRCCRIIVR